MKLLLSFFCHIQINKAITFNWLPFGFILFLQLGLAIITNAQNKVWDKTLGGTQDDKLSTMVATPDGGYLLGGSSYSDKSGDKSEASRGQELGLNDYWVVKVDSQGKKVWDKTFGGERNDNLITIAPTADGGYILGGFSDSPVSGEKSESSKGKPDQSGYYSYDYWLVKIDANGKKIWDKTLGGGGYDELTALVVTPDDGFLVGGYSLSRKGYDKSESGRGESDYWVIKVDGSGKKIWDKTFGGKSLDNLTSLVTTSDGGYLLSGISKSGKEGDKSEPSRDGKDINNNGDYWLVKINAQGAKAWDKTFGGGRSDMPYSLLRTPDNGFLVGGYSNSNKGQDKSKSAYGFWVIRLKANGEKVWEKIYGTTKDVLISMVAASDGGYILGGRNYYVVKIEEDGTKVWDKTYNTGNLSLGILSTLVAVSDEGYVLGGYNNAGKEGDKSQESKGGYDYWILKINDANRRTQTISITNPLIIKKAGDAPITLSAKASSGLPTAFSLVSGPGTLKGKELSFTGVGKIIIKISQPGNNIYMAAPDVTQTVIVDPQDQFTIDWDKTFGGPFNDGLTTLFTTPDKGYLLGGITRKTRDNESGFSITKISNKGQKEWEKYLGGDNDTRLEIGIVAVDSGYLFGGSANTAFSAEYSRFYLVKTSLDGTTEWSKTYFGPGLLHTLITTPDGGYLLGGNSFEYKEVDKTEEPRGSTDYWVVKIDAAGNKLWDKTLGGKEYENLTSLIATPDGGYLVGGFSNSNRSGDKSENNHGTLNQYSSTPLDYWIVKLDKNGKQVWDKTLGGNQEDYLSSIVPTSDNGYLLAGYSNSGVGGNKSEDTPGVPDVNGIVPADYWIIKVNASGTKVWDKTFGGKEAERLSEVVAIPDGGYLLVGSSSSGISSIKTQENRGGSDYWLLKINNEGTKVWDKTLGGNNNDGLTALLLHPDGSYLLGGTSFSGANGDKSEPTQENWGDFWLVKLKEEEPLTAQWNMRYGGSGQDNFTSVIKTLDGGYLSGGYTNSDNTGDKSQSSLGKNDYWIEKSDKNGKQLWDKRYGGTDDDYLNRVIQTQDGGYLLAGSSLSGKSGDKTEINKGERDYWVIKVDKQGNKEWDKTYGGSGYDELKKAIQLSTGDYVLGGHSNSPIGGDKSQAAPGGTDYWLVKISKNGTILWDKRYGGSDHETLGSFTETRDGGFFLGGISYSGQSGDKTHASQGASDYWCVKTDKDGNLLWEKTFGGSGEDEVYSVQRSHGDNLYLAGTSSSGKNGHKSQESQGGKDYWLIKLDKNGSKLWDRSFGGSQDDELQASTFTEAGHYILVGHSYSDATGDKTQTSQGSSDYWVVEVDEIGNKVQDQRFGGSGKEELRTVTQTRDGGLLLGGRSDSGISGDRSQPSQGGTDYWLVKLSPNTTLHIATSKASFVDETVDQARFNPLTAYPNPFHELVNISFRVSQTQQVFLKIYTNQGKEVATLFQGEAKADQEYICKWQANKSTEGIYILRLQGKEHISHQKVVLTR